MDDEAKKNLVVFQATEGLRTRDDAVEKILHMLPTWQAQERRIKEMEERINKLTQRTSDLSSEHKIKEVS